jgi:UTP--glucose-1-phosphate uridylyltransferase
MYGLRFDGHRYDIGNKLDFIRTNVRFALERDELREDLTAFLKEVVRDLE